MLEILNNGLGIPSYVEYDGLTATTATEKIAERKSISLGMTLVILAAWGTSMLIV